MNKGFIPTLILIPKRNADRFISTIYETDEIDNVAKEVVLRTVDIESKKWFFFKNPVVAEIGSRLFPFSLRYDIDNKKLELKRSKLDEVFKSMIEEEFKLANKDFNQFSLSDQVTLTKLFNAVSLQFYLRSSCKSNESVSYFKNDPIVAYAIEAMEKNIAGENPTAIDVLTTSVDIVVLFEDLEEVIQEFYDRYDSELCSFTFNFIFKTAYTSDAIIMLSSEDNYKNESRTKVLSIIGHCAGLRVWEPDTEYFEDLDRYSSDYHQNKIEEVAEDILSSFTLNDGELTVDHKSVQENLKKILGDKFTEDLFDEDGYVKNPDVLMDAIEKSDVGIDVIASIFEKLGIGVEMANSIDDIMDRLKNEMSPDEFERFSKRFEEVEESLKDNEDHPEFIN